MRMRDKIFRNAAVAALAAGILLGAGACSKEEAEKLEAVKDRKVLPGLATKKITTVISDSGITRYRIYTDQWDIFDRASSRIGIFRRGFILSVLTKN